MADSANISVDTLHQLLTYDPETGLLRWKQRTRDMFATQRHCSVWNARYAGTLALNCTSSGYRLGAIFNRSYKGHRVSWALHYGQWPDGEIDHINGDGLDNRIANLRVVDQAENMKNLRTRRTSTTGVPGVSFYRKAQKWQARIGTEHLGYFDTLDEASHVRRQAERARGYHPNHGRR